MELTGLITVGDNVNIGINKIILPGVNIGNNVIIRAGSVVSRDISDNSVAVGDPTIVIKLIDEYLEKAKKKSLNLGNLEPKEITKELKNF